MKELDGMSFFKWIGKHSWYLIIVQVLAVALSVVFTSSFFMPKEYKSSAIVYPSNLWEYSKEIPSEQMLEFLSSVDIKNEVIKRFDLTRHYNIAAGGEVFLEKTLSLYDKNVVISPTQYGAIEVKVYDINADTAYLMVNGILDELNKKILQVQEAKSLEVANFWKRAMERKQKQVDSLTTLSKFISTQFGMMEYYSQSKELCKAYYQALFSRGGKLNDDITDQVRNMEEKGIEYRSVNQLIESDIDDYAVLEGKYEDAMNDVNKHYSFWNMISSPFKPTTYCYPIRWLMIPCICFAVFIFSVIFLRFIERIK